MERNVQVIWTECQHILRDNLTPSVYMTWFAPIRAISFENDVLVLQVKSQFIVEYIEENYLTLLSKVLFRMFGPQTKLEYRVQIDSHTDAGVNIPSDVSQAPVAPPVLLQQPDLKDEPDFNSQLNPSYTFESFVQGESNKLARTVALSIAAQPGRGSFNPLFVYGGSGVGKTHLANAIGNDVKRLLPQKRVLYVSANTFQLQYQDAAAHNHIPDFLLFYQTIDVLIVDDIQYIAGKRATQDTFFHIFNYLQQSGKQIVLTSDKAPKDLDGLEDRLLSRFKWGLAAEMTKPDFALRRDILLNKMHRDGVKLSMEIVEFIATNVRDNVRDLEGVLAALLAYSTLADKEIDMQLAEQVVGRIVELKPRETTIAEIAQAVCSEFKVSMDALLSQSRLREVVVARNVSMYLAARHTAMTKSDIGRYLGNRTHATVAHSLEVLDTLLQNDIALGQQIRHIENLIAG
ncbi:MAG: chromosomal replication initiator protein DnaA [Paludibacteraceae bacterium]|nr:chromosomal replication initiator protein DnaA [Paludibacteraceae bacterium]